MVCRTGRRLCPVSHPCVRLTDAFWAPRMEANRSRTLWAIHEQMTATGRLDAWKMNWRPGKPFPPHRFWDSDVAKWLEAAAYSLATHPDSKLEAEADRVIDMIRKAQHEDGYLNIYYTVVEPQMRWKNLRDNHELYCAGHLMEAAVAYADATGKREFLDVMCRYADTIDAVFGRAKGQLRGYPGHEEVELALVKLSRAAGEPRYADLAAYFINERGRQPHYFDTESLARGEDPNPWQRSAIQAYDYNQSHQPVREQASVEGHAVRAMYLYCGMADVAAETGDRTLLAACRRLWDNCVSRRMYVTGGVGSTRMGERFTFDYDLPNETGYAETCAAIGLVFWAHRMLHLGLDARYADVMERCLYNSTLSGVSLDGERFFYVNPHAVHPEAARKSPRHDHVRVERPDWYACACCPPNIARMVAKVGQYAYSTRGTSAFVHLYAQGEAQFRIGRTPVILTQKTRYPWGGKVRLTVRPEAPATFTLALRIPGWCREAGLTLNGKRQSIHAITRKGYARIRRQWQRGDRLDLDLPMPVERVEARPDVRMDCGRVALMRGPVVYCLEEVDNGPNLAELALPRDARLSARFEADRLGGVVVVAGKALRRDPSDWGPHDLYRPSRRRLRSVPFRAIPYCVWANRKPGEMIVWIREAL